METIILIAIVAIPIIAVIAFLICSAAIPRFNSMMCGIFAAFMILLTIFLVLFGMFNRERWPAENLPWVLAPLILFWFLYRLLVLVRIAFDEDEITNVYLVFGTLIEERVGPSRFACACFYYIGAAIISIIVTVVLFFLMQLLCFLHLSILTIVIPIAMLIYCIVTVCRSFADDCW